LIQTYTRTILSTEWQVLGRKLRQDRQDLSYSSIEAPWDRAKTKALTDCYKNGESQLERVVRVTIRTRVEQLYRDIETLVELQQ